MAQAQAQKEKEERKAIERAAQFLQPQAQAQEEVDIDELLERMDELIEQYKQQASEPIKLMLESLRDSIMRLGKTAARGDLLVSPQGSYRRWRVIVFDLPTEYYGAEVEMRKEGNTFTEVRRFREDPRIYRTLRWQFYQLLSNIAVRTKAGWVLLPDLSPEETRELQDIMNKLNKIAGTRRAVEVIDMYIRDDWLKQELEDYINWLKHRVDEISAKLANEQLKANMKRSMASRKAALERVITRATKLLQMLR